MLSLPLLLLAGHAVGVRRAKYDEDDSTAGLEKIAAILEEHAATSGAASKSLEQLLALTESTPTVAANLTGIVELLRDDLAQQVEKDNTATQDHITGTVTLLVHETNIARQKKLHAERMDQIFHGCVTVEEGLMRAVVEKQNKLNEKETQKVAPCGREASTEDFVHPGSEFNLICELGVDEDCTRGIEVFVEAVARDKGDVQAEVDGSVSQHEQAERDCRSAEGESTWAAGNVSGAQEAWENKKTTCTGDGNARDSSICTFGEKLQAACETLQTYETQKEKVEGNGTNMSSGDRMEEWKAIQTVICLLDSFLENNTLSNETLTTCSNVDTSMFTVNTWNSNVTSALINTTFEITCLDTEDIGFHGKKWDSPGQQDLPDYTAHTMSKENETLLPQYKEHTPWTETFDKAQQEPFVVCQQSV